MATQEDTTRETFDSQRDVERVGGSGQPERELIEKVAGSEPTKENPSPKAPELTDEEQQDATAWLLASFDSDEGDSAPPIQHLVVNVGSREAPKKIPWTVQAVPRDVIAKIRERAQNASDRRRTGATLGIMADPDATFEGNLELVVEGTVEPDLRRVAKERNIAQKEFLRQAFGYKGGLIDYLAGEVLDLSGYNDEAVEDAVVARAAGN